MKTRYIALTDINNGIEIDDIQSLVRLLIYSDVIDIEGIINCTSCFVKKTGKKQNRIIHKHIDAYEKVKSNLDIHSDGFPSSQYLHSITKNGIPVFGKTCGVDFGTSKYDNNEGVQLIFEALQKEDPRPLWFGLWGGANTLAQALWMVENYLPEQMDAIFSKVRIYNISDQDYASKWIRERYGERLTIIVTPSAWTHKGSKEYYKATWPGISADSSEHGCEDGIHKTKGFKGADARLVGNFWIQKNIRRKGALGKRYPFTHFITEGDTPSFLGLIPNGLNDYDHIDYGGWGGRFVFQKLENEECYAFSNSFDEVFGNDQRLHKSSQATIWRWREDFQNDFSRRMNWCIASSFNECKHPAKIEECKTEINVNFGENVQLSINAHSPDNDSLIYEWLHYPEAGGNNFRLKLNKDENKLNFIAPDKACNIHIIAKVYGDYAEPFVSYKRFVVTVSE